MTDTELVSLFSKPQYGGDLPYFVGNQYGSGVLNSMKKLAFPLMKKAGELASRVARNTASDVFKGKGVGEALKTNALNEAESVVNAVGDFLGNKRPSSDSETGMNKRRKTISSKGTIF